MSENLPVNDGLLQVFDVEHGACALFTVPDVGGGFKRLMIDCGHNSTTGYRPGDHLRRLNVGYLDQLVITNYDEDHVSGFPNLQQRGIDIGWILRNPTVSPHTIQKLKTEDGMGNGIAALVGALSGYAPAPASAPPSFRGVSIGWFYNQYPFFDDENNLSLMLHLNVLGVTFLFPGDMERAGFENMLKTNQSFREIVPVLDVLMAAHHGRRNGICPDMFDIYGCKPTLTVISDDYKQYDTQETGAYYASKTIGIDGFRNETDRRKVLTTRNDGEIRFSWSGGRCTVS